MAVYLPSKFEILIFCNFLKKRNLESTNRVYVQRELIPSNEIASFLEAVYHSHACFILLLLMEINISSKSTKLQIYYL